ncbi:MAG: recombination regulator RecX [Clostridiales bacterium]|nr:recombination regulator RecX [Clostridiales bacterium]
MAKKQKTTGGASAYDTALRYLTPKARTVREVELKLDEGCFSEGEIMQTVERLQDAGLLNDAKYAEEYVASRLRTKPVSKFRLREQLKGHFVPEDVIEAALAEVPDETEFDNAVAVARKFLRQFEGLDDEEEKRKRIYSRLYSRGYSHETIEAAIEEAKAEL